MIIDRKDIESIKEVYNEAYNKHGYSSAAVLWGIKEKQMIRYQILLSKYNWTNKRILDIGCGFGDINAILQEKTDKYSYLGYDINEKILRQANELYKNQDNVQFKIGDFLSGDNEENFDYGIISGMFNIAYNNTNQYDMLDAYFEKVLKCCKDGLAFNFLSNKVNFYDEGFWYFAPEKVLEMAYKYSRNVALRSDYMPFDFTIFIFNDDSFDDNRIFNRYYKAGEMK